MQVVLIVDDDTDTRDLISVVLMDGGYRTLQADDASGMWRELESESVDLIILDYLLPDENGLNLTRLLRKNSEVGIIMISGKVPEIDGIIGLELGADDYLEKPFTPRMLLARVRSVLRRTSDIRLNREDAAEEDEVTSRILSFDGWRLNPLAYRLTDPSGKDVHLTTVEFRALLCLIEKPNRVIHRDQIINCVHGQSWSGYDRGIDSIISRLRNKVKPGDGKPQYIKTIRGAGYLFTSKVHSSRPDAV